MTRVLDPRLGALVISFALSSLGVVSVAHADVLLPAVFSPHMVLQEGRALPFWGKADPGETVTVEALGKRAEARADGEGRWRLTLPALPANADAFSVIVRGKNQIQLDDVLLGEVWIASGQSNMEWALHRADNGAREVSEAKHPRIRLFHVPHGPRPAIGAEDVDATWQPCTPEAAETFSAVAYYFARELQRATGKPIGIINTSWGGTPAEAWTRLDTLAKHPLFRKRAAPFLAAPADLQSKLAQYEREIDAWERKNRHEDPPNQGEAQNWARWGIGVTGWTARKVPGHWEDAGLDMDGVMWFRKDVAVPPNWVGRDLELHLGAVNDCDTTYVQGEKIGHTCRDTPAMLGRPRKYVVPGRLVKAGRLLVAVRVFDERGNGGFSSGPEALFLRRADEPQGHAISLAGLWNTRVEKQLPSMTPDEASRPAAPAGLPTPHSPGILWQTMVQPLVPFAIRGAIWYQGEANVDRAYRYRDLFPTMIRDWRAAWGEGDFPFYFVQLAAFHPTWPGPGHKSEDEWAELREAQFMTLSRVPHTGMAVTIDIGNRNDIHPTNKLDVGKRLSLWALAQVYGKKVDVSGPLYDGFSREKGAIRVRFRHAEGLTGAGAQKRIVGFEVAGPERRFVHADARIEGETVVVSAPNVKNPAAVRYAWSDDPLGNLRNRAGLPASPFRTDNWPGLTVAAE